MVLEVMLPHLAGSSEQPAAPWYWAEEQQEVLVQQTVDLAGGGVRETAAALITADWDIFPGRRRRRRRGVCDLSWMILCEVIECRLRILQLNGGAAFFTLEERGSRAAQIRWQLVHLFQFISQSPVANQQSFVDLGLNLQRLLQLSNTTDG